MSGSAPAQPVAPGAHGAALRRALPFTLAALGFIVAGGLVAAATAYISTEKTAWATAYLVLVGGIAQIVLGLALGWLAPRANLVETWVAFVLWNIGNLGVLSGQLTGAVALTFIGGGLLVVALVLIILATLRRKADAPAPHPALLWAFRAVVVILAVTIPIGLVLAALGK